MAETFNYFNYYTEIEEYFWQKRGGALLVSTLDWAVIESWQKAGIPLEVVFKGIDHAFEHYDAKKRGRPVKSLAYCVDAVADAADTAREAAVGRHDSAEPPSSPALEPGTVARFFRANAAELRSVADTPDAKPAFKKTLNEVAGALEGLAEQPSTRESATLEDLERHMTVFEEKLQAAITQSAPAETLVEIRREVDRSLSPYRRKMKTGQLAMIEKQFLQKKLFEHFRLPRLSLFYLQVAPLSGAPEGE